MSTSTSARHASFGPEPATASGPALAPLTPAIIRFQAQQAIRPVRRSGRDRAVRVLNVLIAAIAIVVAAPVMLLIAIAVRVTSPGPLIYSQPRVGIDRRRSFGPTDPNHRRALDLGGRIFTIYKFRTMYQRGSGGQVWARSGDPRVTPVGRFLRSFRLDELPQLFNVLKGDMNIVGPRPEQPEIFADLKQEVRHYRTRQRVLPGITGLAQITLPYDRNIEDVRNKVDLDLQYIRDRSVSRDLVIMAKTMPVMVLRKGAM